MTENAGIKMQQYERPPELESITVEYKGYGRVVNCFCGETVNRSIVPHLKSEHLDLWKEWIRLFIGFRRLGYPLKRIMRLFSANNDELLFSWTVIERAIRREVEAGTLAFVPPPKKRIDRWQPDDFVLEKTTVWDFPKRGDWAVHAGDYRGNWPPQVARNLIEQYTQPGDLVVDAFVGGGTTLIEAWLLGRPSVGLDISNLALQTSKAKVKEMGDLAKEDDSISLDPGFRPKIYRGNALKLNSILRGRRNEFGEPKLVCIHPPYLNSLEYTGGHKDDLALISNPVVFCKKMQTLARQIRRVLAGDGVCGVLIGDVRKQGNILPIGFQTLQAFLTCGFELRNLVIKTQHRDRSSEFYVNLGNSSLLIAHEYLFILKSSPDNDPQQTSVL